MDLVSHFSDTAFLANMVTVAVHGHEKIYGGDEGLRHHLCLHHGEHLDEGTPAAEMEERHEDEHGYSPAHRGEYGCPEHGPEDEPHEWDELHEGIGPIHRGIGVDLPDELHKVVHDRRRRPADRAQALLSHLREYPNGGIGVHWSTGQDVAEDFAERSGRSYATGRKPGTAVVFHAAEPRREDIDHNIYSDPTVYGYHDHGEREVPLVHGDNASLTGISWAPMHDDWSHPRDGVYERHDFGGHEPREASAAFVPRDSLPDMEQPGLYWRAHPSGLPLDAEHAWSHPVGPGYDDKDPTDLRRGYSAFAHPYHLAQYMPEFFGEDSDHRTVHAFHGHQVGTGTDGEPLVMPEADHSCCGRVTHAQMPWHEFERRAWDNPDNIPEHIEPGPWESRPWMHEASAAPDAPAQSDDVVDLYHHTYPESAEAIYRERHFEPGSDEDRVYFTNMAQGGSGESDYGTGVVHLRMPRALVNDWGADPHGEHYYDVSPDDIRPEHFVDPKPGSHEAATQPVTAAWDASGSENTGVYLRFGHWPENERSFSPAGGYHEWGVSAYDLDRHGDPAIDHGLDRNHVHDEHCEEDCDIPTEGIDNDPREEMQGRVSRAEKNRRWGDDKPHETGHLVRGEMTGVGYDGEPLLQNVRRVGDWIDHRHLFIPGAQPHRLARDPSDEDYEPPEEQPQHSGREASLAGPDPREQPHMVPVDDLHGVASMNHPGMTIGEVWEYHHPEDEPAKRHGDEAAAETARQQAGLRDYVESGGSIPGALITCSHGSVLEDGEHRYMAARDAGLEEVPVKKARGCLMPELHQFRKEAASRPGRDERQCPCCKGAGSHGSDSCEACDGDGHVGRSDQVEHCPGEPQPRRRHWREASMPEPDYEPSAELPVGRGIWYRAHLAGQPLDEAHATSKTLNRPWPGSPGADHPGAAQAGQNGYSAFAHPQHLRDYMHEYGWVGEPEVGWDDREVVAFHGRQVGRGADNEPLVHPEPSPACCGNVIHSRMPWEDFEQRLPGAAPLHPKSVPPWKTMFAPDPTPRSKSVRRHYKDETDRVNREKRRERHQERNGKAAAMAVSRDEYGYQHKPLRDRPALHEGGGIRAPQPGPRDDEATTETITQYRAAQGAPDRLVRAYRTAPAKSGGMINTGDWVTLGHGYAREMADDRNFHDEEESLLNDPKTGPERFHVYEATVPARHLRGASDPMEWGYWGDPVQAEHSPRCGQGECHERTAALDASAPPGDDPSADGKELLGHFEAAGDQDYRMQHQGPSADDGEAMHEVGSGGAYPTDIHEHPDWYIDSDGPGAWDSWDKVRKSKGWPSRRVTMYRSLPSPNRGVNTGDWVSSSAEYAIQHGRQTDSADDWPVVKFEARADQLRTDGNSINEWSYHGPPIRRARVHYRGGRNHWGKGEGGKIDADLADHESPEMHAAYNEQTAERRRRIREERERQQGLGREAAVTVPDVVAHFEEPAPAPAPPPARKRAARQHEGDERPFGWYTMRYRTDDQGERKPRHVIESTTPDGTVAGRLTWYGTTGRVYRVEVAGPEDNGTGMQPLGGDGLSHHRRGLATAMWDWSQEMTPRARHSGDQTQHGKDWAAALGRPRKEPPAGPPPSALPAKEAAMAVLGNPHTGGHEWYHGSPYRFGSFGDDQPDHPLLYHDDDEDGSHWNTLLGHHFAASHQVAEEFGRGEHSPDPEGNYDDATPQENIIHARLGIRNPKVYRSEHDMDQEAYEHEWQAGNHHDAHHDPELTAEADEYGTDDLPPTYQYRGHGDRMRSRDEADPVYWNVHRTYHPYATGWLNSHPDKGGIAQRFRDRLLAQGHDGIVYGNEFEGSQIGKGDNHHVAALPFGGSQIDVTQRHTGPDCIPEEEATRQWPGRHQEPLFNEHGEPHEGSVVAHFEDPAPVRRTAAGPVQQLKLFHMQPEPGRYHPETGRRTPADPAWRRANDPDNYEPDECEHCGGDQNFPEEHADTHHQWLTSQDWYTDWNEDHLPDTIHRGVGLDLPDHVHNVVHDTSRPVHERAHALLSHVLGEENPGGSGLGNFWSGHSGVAKVYAESAARRYGRNNVQTPVIVHAHTPPMEHIETDPDQLQHWGVHSYHLAGNREVPISHGAPLRIRGISWAPPGHARDEMTRDEPPRLEDDPAWTHHEVGGEGIRATASGTLTSGHAEEQRAALEMVAHFDNDDEEDPDGYHGDEDDREDDDEDEGGRDGYYERHEAEQAARQATLPYVSPPPEGEILDHLTHMHGVDPRTFDLHLSPASQARWHDQEHAHRTSMTHQHAQLRGTPGERQWPDAFQLSEHTDFAGGTPGHGRFQRVLSDPSASRPFAPLMPSESSLHMPAANDGVVAHFGGEAAGNPACYYCGEPLDDEDVRDGASAHDECDSMRWCEACQEHHDNPQVAEDHNETYTDWANHLPFEGGIHRGLTMELPEAVHAIVHDESRPSAERATAMAAHLHGSPLGVHWTDHEQVARNWGSGEGALFGPSEHERSSPSWTHLVVHAASPDDEHVETDPDVLSGRDMLGFDHPRSEREVPLRDDAPVHVTGFSWKRADRPDWQRHDLPGPVTHTAAIDGSSVVAHFAVESGHMDENGFHWDPEHDDGEVHLAPPYAGQQLYHGTRSLLEQGEMLTPGEAARHPAHPFPDDGKDYVHATPHYSEARYWGEHANAGETHERMTEMGRGRAIPDRFGPHHVYPPRVYEVHPTGDVVPDPNGEGQSYRSASPMRVGREVWPVQCRECEQEHNPGHPHYEWSREQDDEDEPEREEAAPEDREEEREEPPAREELPAAGHPDDPAAIAEGDAMEAHLRQAHRYDDADIGVATSRASNPRGRRNSLNAAHRGDHAVSGFDHPHPHPPLTVNRRPDGGPTIPMMDALQAQMAEHRWRNATAAQAAPAPAAGPVLYHGTDQELAPGDLVHPENAVGFRRGQGRVFATENPAVALRYGNLKGMSSGLPGRAYAVHPTGPVEPDDTIHENFQGWRSAHPFRVAHEVTGVTAVPLRLPEDFLEPRQAAGLAAREGAWDDDEDPDRYVHCDQGHEHWGANGAAGMLIRHHGDDGHTRYLLQRRSPYVQHGNTWSTPGGALASGETPEEGAWREAEEELGPLPDDVTHHHTHTDDHGSWAYHTVVADSPRMFEPHGGHPDADWESSGHRWVTAAEMNGLPLHPGFAASWSQVRKSGALGQPPPRGARDRIVIAVGVDDKVALPAAPAREPRIRIGAWVPETAGEAEQMVRDFPAMLRALYEALEALAGQMDEQPVTEEIPAIIRRMAAACLRASEDADGLLPPPGEDPPEGTWQGPRAIGAPKG